MRAEEADDIAAAMANRVVHWRLRVGLAGVVVAVFHPTTSWPFALAWFAAYAAIQVCEVAAGPASRLATWFGRQRYAGFAMALVFVNNVIFGLFAARQAFSSDPLGPAFAGLMVGGAMVNAVLVSTNSRAFTVASIAPQLIYLVLIPVGVLMGGRGWVEAVQVTTATGLLIVAAAVAWTRLSVTMAEMNSTRLAAEEANRAKTRFLATMSHEIRTPLNGVLGMTQAIARDELSERQRDRLAIVAQSGEAVLAIIDDVLDLAKIEASRLELEVAPFDLEVLVRQAHATFSAIAAAKDLEFTVEIETPALGAYLGDAARVRQILYNIISNALKFTASGQVTIRAAWRSGDFCLQVVDTGPGVAPDHLPRLFEKFVQADASTTRRFGGTGLGLSICRELASLMRGRIEAANVEPQGLAVSVVLPMPRTHIERQPEPQASDADLELADRPLAVLAAEDHIVNQQVLHALLGHVGIIPHIVENGQLALEAWRTGHWDVILMDVQMPVMDGPTATRVIRQEEAAGGRPATPIIALTANVMSHQLEEYREAGMDHFVAKPIQVSALLQAIRLAAEAPGVAPEARSTTARGVA